MEPADRDSRSNLEQELLRIGLSIRSMPAGGLAGASGALEGLVKHIRTLAPGSTWHEVFPDLPKHWIAGRPDTWTGPYRPFGPFDYQELPTSPAVHVLWESDGPQRLKVLLAAAGKAGFRVHGAGIVAQPPSSSNRYHAFVIMERGTDEAGLEEFSVWVSAQPGFTLVAVPRTGREEYLTP